jgi:putative ABC transport system permease protein
MEQLFKDLVFSSRAMRRNPAFTLTAVAVLALGIGASTAMFSVVNAVLLRPLPYPEPDRLALVFWENRAAGSKSFLYSNADFFDLRGGTSEIFEDMGGITSFRAFVTREDGSTEQIGKALVTTNFFRLMGARVAVGRDFDDADAVPQPAQEGVLIPPGSAAILSYEYWQRRYGGSERAIGNTIAGGPRIVGVLAPGFRLFFPAAARIDASPDFFVANNLGYDAAHRNLMTVGGIGRLRSGVTLRRAQDRMDALRASVRKSSFDPDAALRLVSIENYLVEEVRPAILALMGAVVFLLLIACANVANLMLVRASMRECELAVRATLGGSWWRLVRQMMTEAVWLSGFGTALGVALAWIGIRAALRMAPDLPRLESAAIDWRVLAFSAIAGVAATAVFGVVPAFRAARPDVNRILRGGRGVMEGGLLRNAVVVVEVALSFVLLIGSGLMLRSFLELRRIDPGYDPRGVLTFFVTCDWSLTRQQGRIELLNRIQEKLRATPGVESATAALVLPLGGGARPKNAATAPRPAGASWEGADFQQVMPGYFETLRTRLVAGRTFTSTDNLPGRNLVVIDQWFAERAFPNESAIGKRVLLPGPDNPSAEVIGVVAHQRLFSLSDPGRETLYLTDGFWGIGASRYWIIRTTGDPAKYAATIRAEIARIDPELVVSKMQTMEALVARDQSGARFSLMLIGAFATVAVLLACVGLYGVLATVVRHRTAEIGVRMALGAAPSNIFRLVVGHGLRLSVCGIAIGLIAAAGLTRMIGAMLVGITATDPSTFAAMTALFLVVAALASWIPAARAAGLDPMAALREQ